jgi:glycosyltransferase involved in cell wall biosynthesis
MIESLPTLVSDLTEQVAPIHVLTLTPFYPSDANEVQGCFVSEPLQWTEQLKIQNTVFAVQPFYRKRVNAIGSIATNSVNATRWIRFSSLPFGFGLPSSGAFLFADILSKVRKLHGWNRIDVIHAHGPLPCGHAAALVARELDIPFVITVHGLDAFCTKQIKGVAGMWAQRVSRFVYRSARKVICVSKKVQECVASAGSTSVRTTVVHNGVDLDMFSPTLLDGSNTILSVGNLIPTKGHALLLRAFSQVSTRFPQLTLEIIGEGPELVHLRELTTHLRVADKVYFLGRKGRKEVAQAMSSCSIFALPSAYEGLGCVYLEAMACGKSVIGCKGQGIEDLIKHGANGWLIEPGNLNELTEGLSLLLSNSQLRMQLGTAARRTIMQNFALQDQAAALNRVYRECLA